MSNLLIDFGASRIKVGISENSYIFKIVDYNSIKPKNLDNIRYEVLVDSLKKLFDDILKDFSSYNPNSIFICSEQHGFSLLSDNNFVTDYISWKDNRAIEEIDGLSTIDFLKLNLPNFKKHTGMNIKPGIPSINLLHMMRLKSIPNRIKIISLPEIFGGNKIHSTMLAGLGIWDIYKKTKYDDLFLLYKELGYEVYFNEPTYDIELTNKINDINIYTAVGDNQCAILGSNLANDQLIINMGTGSQIAKLDMLDINNNMEQRPYFKDNSLSIITHIPSGRALNCFVGFIDECFKYVSSEMSAWKLFDNIKLEDIINSSMKFNLKVFDSAYGFENGGAINLIKENNFNTKNYIASLLKSYIEQYFNIIEEYSIKYTDIILSGGIPMKISLIKDYIKNVKKQNVIINGCKEDETLQGLKIISNF
ncbi:hypothetical protein [Brachyspira murdochii]|uniref:hypothetical protein n=1 Tax=Brachyspira murdochii TaxID=84378 RepID=UPI0012F50F3F|nr:hypothetical protein [Brachyspira murdochii]